MIILKEARTLTKEEEEIVHSLREFIDLGLDPLDTVETIYQYLLMLSSHGPEKSILEISKTRISDGDQSKIPIAAVIEDLTDDEYSKLLENEAVTLGEIAQTGIDNLSGVLSATHELAVGKQYMSMEYTVHLMYATTIPRVAQKSIVSSVD